MKDIKPCSFHKKIGISVGFVTDNAYLCTANQHINMS